MKKLFFLIFFAASISILANQSEDLSVSNLFADGVVLQQKTQAAVWGWNNPGEQVSIKASWGELVETQSNEQGKWLVKIETPEAGGPFTLQISDADTMLTINNVLIGEVWVCSGQSNMDMPLAGWVHVWDTIDNFKTEIHNANFPQIRMFNVEKAVALDPATDVTGQWLECSPEQVGDFSAVGYFFGRELHKELKVPIGLIHTSYGASPAEAWMSEDELVKISDFDTIDLSIREVKSRLEIYNTWFAGLKQLEYDYARHFHIFDGLNLNDSSYMLSQYDDSKWQFVQIPSDWENTIFKGYDGAIWFRKSFEIEENEDLNSLTLHLGVVHNIDVTYLNGVEIGKTYSEDLSKNARVYSIPTGLIKKGTNTLAIRIVDTWGKGGIIEKDKPYIAYQGLKVYELAGPWKYKAVARFYGNQLYTFGEGDFSFDSEPRMPFVLNQYAPTSLFNAMVAPILPYAIKGVTWYQGESNTSNPKQYELLFPALINNWRAQWKNEELPFYFVQLAPLKNYDNDKGKNTAELRDAQRSALNLPNTGMAVILDAGDKWRIHPGKKQQVGQRLAYLALANQYDYLDLASTGPLYQSIEFKGNKGILSFTHIHGGLELEEASKSGFEIAGVDGQFLPALAKIDGEKIIIWSEQVKNPTQARYAWTNWVDPTLYNTDGLPASSFKTY